ncbi:hypothetical protein DENSPDRAFT_771496 [Dentipellis sp. KUC8613]|nr:hypothetical protein DENSPDRAFT_771496 [Dentipellis sp. KUC8613]
MTATTMHFGPEWMRPKHSSRPQNPPSPPPTNAHASPGMSSYSSLVAPAVSTPQEKPDVVNPFKYPKEEMLRIFKEGGGQGGLGLEVERWEGVVREVGSEPVSMKEWGDAEKKLFAGPLNSEVRRRQSTDHLSPLVTPSTDRPKLLHTASGASSPMRERFLGRRREGPDQTPLTIPRKLSLTSTPNAMNSPRDSGLSSPRSRAPLTPGFDGVLSSGDTWTSRRRLSESGSKTTVQGARAEGDGDGPEKGPGIKEEEEEPNLNGHGQTAESGTSAIVNSMNNISLADPKGQAADGTSNPSSNGTFAAGQDAAAARGQIQPPTLAASPPGLPDPASIEWSYVDPQGQIQGPFPAETMQKWYEGGYFNPTLLMKRPQIDTEWTPLGDLAARAIGDRLFLSQFASNAPPPGLPRQVETRQDSMILPRDMGGFNAPYQPVPTRTLHTSALDTYLASGSTASNSPSSSFNPGRFGDHSPDPSVFAGRVSSHGFPTNGSPVGSRTGSYAADPSTFSVPRRAGFNDSPYDQGFASRPSVGNIASVRTPSMDGFGMNSLSQPSPGIWPGSNIQNGPGRADSLDSAGPFTPNLGQGVDPSFASQAALARNYGNVRAQDPMGGIYNAIGATNQRDLSRLGTRDPFPQDEKQLHHGELGLGDYTNGVATQSPFGTPVLSQAYSQSPSLQYASPQLQAPSGGSTGQVGGQQPKPPTPRQQQPLSAPQSPWHTTEESVPKRTGLAPFDNANYPTVSNTIPSRDTPPHQASPWGRPNQGSVPASAVDEHSPWFSASQSGTEEGWGPAHGPSSLTVSNLGQHNQQQEQEEALRTHANEPTPAEASEATKPAQAQAAARTPEPAAQSIAKSPRASGTQAAPAPVSTLTPPAPSQEAKTPTTPSSVAPTKPVWSTEEDKKKAAGATPSLREIQEAETKKQEARKAAERAARAAATATSSPAEETQSFTASWGLPTSKVNSTRTVPTAKETGASTPATPAAPNGPAAVWTNTAKPAVAKKTMKEIQEEEERRKKLATKETAAAAATRRAYAETTTKAAPPTLAVGGAWTTVGSNGKTSLPVTPSAATRPAMTSAASATAASPVRIVNGSQPTRPAVPAAVKASPAIAKVEETPVAPSADFMKWLSDSLKGLNASVNFEEITSMLLQFPLEVDPTTMEIISELIYANSTTLDGRRFAQEFVTKRKADAVARKSGASGKGPSIADVVRSQPKPSQSEWGGFKVVNKKKKGGRA